MNDALEKSRRNFSWSHRLTARDFKGVLRKTAGSLSQNSERSDRDKNWSHPEHRFRELLLSQHIRFQNLLSTHCILFMLLALTVQVSFPCSKVGNLWTWNIPSLYHISHSCGPSNNWIFCKYLGLLVSPSSPFRMAVQLCTMPGYLSHRLNLAVHVDRQYVGHSSIPHFTSNVRIIHENVRPIIRSSFYSPHFSLEARIAQSVCRRAEGWLTQESGFYPS
jgi:hypothetical protein